MFTERATPELLAVSCPTCKAPQGVHCAIGSTSGGMVGKGKYALTIYHQDKPNERQRMVPAVHAKRAKKAREQA